MIDFLAWEPAPSKARQALIDADRAIADKEAAGEPLVSIPRDIIKMDEATGQIIAATQNIVYGRDGEVHEGDETPIAPLSDEQRLALGKLRLLGEIERKREQLKLGGAPTTLGVVDTSGDNLTLIGGRVQMADFAQRNGEPFAKAIALLDGTLKPVDSETMILVGREVGEHIDAIYGYALRLGARVNASTSLGKLLSIDIERGWPEAAA